MSAATKATITRADSALTPKGERRAAEILDATVRCLARDGYSATSIQAVADEAGLHKRVVLYYYGSREGLFDRVVRHLGDELFDELERELGALDDPEEIVGRGYERLWKVVTRDRPLVISWFALRAESVTNPTLASTARYVTDRFRALVSGLIDQALGRGRTLRFARGSLGVLILAGFQGLILEYLERGDTPQLRTAIDDFQIWLASVSEPPS